MLERVMLYFTDLGILTTAISFILVVTVFVVESSKHSELAVEHPQF